MTKPLNNIATFQYKNHRGEIAIRSVAVDAIEFIREPGYNYQPGWFISGICQDRMQRRSFALSHIVISPGEKYHTILQIKEK